MLLLAGAFFVAGVLLLRSKRPGTRQGAFRLFRGDEIAMSTVLLLIGACMVAIELFA